MKRFGELPKPSPAQLVARATVWAWAVSRLGFRVALDRAQGRKDDRQRGVRLRQFFEDVGGTGVKMGQQLSLRTDVLPQAICDELAQLVDRVTAMSGEQARAVIEESLGSPVSAIFASFEDTPIGSASVACVYRARLLDGTDVAVKVRRPEVEYRFAEDLFAFDTMSWCMEYAGFVREGTFKHLRKDLRIMFGEELDFRREARYQRLFRRFIRGARLPYMSSPKVYAALCRENVMVSAFVRGASAASLLAAVERQDTAKLLEFAAQDIDPAVVAEQFFRFAMWARFEALFFHADPHPGNMLIQPGNRIVMLDFGACGTTGLRARLNKMEIVRLMERRDGGDATKMANVMLTDNGPLPLVDIDQYYTELASHFNDFALAVDDHEAHWSERIIVGIWLRMLDVARKYQIRMNLDTARSIRAFLLYDTFAFRLDGTLDASNMAHYLKDAAWRTERSLTRRVRRLSPKQHERRVKLRRDELLRRVMSLIERLAPAMESARLSFEIASSQAERAARFWLRNMVWLSTLGVGWSLFRLHSSSLFAGAAVHPLVWLVFLAVVLRWVRMALRALAEVHRR